MPKQTKEFCFIGTQTGRFVSKTANLMEISNDKRKKIKVEQKPLFIEVDLSVIDPTNPYILYRDAK